MPLEDILLEAEEAMDKAVDHLHHELRGIRTGRASPALVENVRVDYYGSPTDLKSIAAITIPEPTQILIRPFSPQDAGAIKTAIEAANLGLNPMVEDKQVRLNLPAMSTDRRKQLAGQVKDLGERTKVSLRNTRRDANKQIDAEEKESTLTEDDAKHGKEEVQKLIDEREAKVTESVKKKTDEVMEV
ncbi:MAG: ribosome recycling factor [Planctomycetota bacterium]